MLSFSEAAIPVLVDVTFKATAILVLAGAAAWALGRRSAAARHLVWSAALVGVLALPFVALFAPTWSAPVNLTWIMPAPSAEQATSVARGDFTQPPQRASNPEAVSVEKQEPPAAVFVASRITPEPVTLRAKEVLAPPPAPRVQETPSRASIGPWVFVAWLAGAMLGLAWLGLGLLGLAELKRTTYGVTSGRTYEILQELVREAGLWRRVRLRQSESRSMPMTWGILRPVVLLPKAAEEWSIDRLRVVLRHELAHIVRWDCLTQLLAQCARMVYWFNPLAWLAMSRIRLLQELACDDIVIDGGVAPSDYAAHLLVVTTGCSPNLVTPNLALGMSRSAALQHRIEIMLDSRRNHRPAGRAGLVLAGVASLCLVIPTATARMTLVAEEFVEPPPPPAWFEPPFQAPSEDPLKKIVEVQKKLREFYVSPLNEKQLVEHALTGLLKGLDDPYTDYLPSEMLAQMEIQFKGGLSGIGVQIRMVDGRITVQTPLEDSPALKAGLRPGDFIQSIDGQDTSSMDLTQAVKKIVGPADSTVKLKVVHANGVVEDMSVTRKQIRIRTVQGFQRDDDGQWNFMLDGEHKVGYVNLLQFGNPTGAELKTVLLKLKEQDVKGLILDLRFCPGGLLSQALETCKQFISDGLILTTKGTGKPDQVFRTDEKAPYADLPLVILVNDETASAGEIVAGALRDHNRAVIVGSRTFGKGSVQAIVKLEDGSAIRVTTSYHYLPSGRNIQKRPGEKTWGVDPTDGYYVPLTAKQVEALKKDQERRNLLNAKNGEHKPAAKLTPRVIEEQHADPQLAGALRTMVAKLTGGEFIKIGKSQALLEDQLQRLEDLRNRRESLQRSLSQIDREITELQQASGGGKKE